MQITGIIGAMDVEVAILRSMMKNARTETVSGIDFIIGSLEGRRVVLARSGVGKVFAALCAQTMILKFGVTEIVNSGVAGTLTPELHIGGINMIELPADTKIADELDRVCAAANVNHRLGVIASGDQFVHTTERREWIVSTFKASAVEMEAAAIAQVCFVNKIPFAAIRVISDEASGDVKIDYMTFVKAAAATSSDIALRWLHARA